MATRTVIVYTDDRTGEEIQPDDLHEHQVTLGNKSPMTIHLNGTNHTRFMKDMAKYIKASEENAASQKRSSRSTKAKRNTHGPAIRKWAKEKGYELPSHGRIPNDVMEAYESEHRG